MSSEMIQFKKEETKLIYQLIDMIKSMPYNKKSHLENFKSECQTAIKKIFGNTSDYLKEFNEIQFKPKAFFASKEDNQVSWEMGKYYSINLLEQILNDPQLTMTKSAMSNLEKKNDVISLSDESQIEEAKEIKKTTPEIKEEKKKKKTKAKGKSKSKKAKNKKNKSKEKSVEEVVPSDDKNDVEKIIEEKVNAIITLDTQEKAALSKLAATSAKSSEKVEKEEEESVVYREIPPMPEFCTGPVPEEDEEEEIRKAKENPKKPFYIDYSSQSGKRVLVVHGRNNPIKEEVVSNLQKLGLEPVVSNEAPFSSLTVNQKKRELSDINFAVIILSFDSHVYQKSEEPNKAKFMARADVIFELGYWIGTLGRENVFVLYLEDPSFQRPTKYFFDALYVPYDLEGNWKIELTRTLQGNGYNVESEKISKSPDLKKADQWQIQESPGIVQ